MKRIIYRERNRDDGIWETYALRIRGFMLKEISKVQGCPIGTVKSRLHRARQKLAASQHNESDNG